MMRSQRTAFREQPLLTQLEKAWAQHRKPPIICLKISQTLRIPDTISIYCVLMDEAL